MSSRRFVAIWIILYYTKLVPRLTFRWWIGEKDPVHQICMQEPPCQVPSIARHAHWLWCDIIHVGQMECISSEHFSEGCLSRTATVYLVILVQLMLMSWKLYSILSVWQLQQHSEGRLHWICVCSITGFDAEACWPLNGPLFSHLNSLYSLMG